MSSLQVKLKKMSVYILILIFISCFIYSLKAKRKEPRDNRTENDTEFSSELKTSFLISDPSKNNRFVKVTFKNTGFIRSQILSIDL